MKRRGVLFQLLMLLLLGVTLVYGIALVIAPWAFHIGGRFTPMLMWQGSGKLHTRNGEYPFYLYFYPDSHFSRLRLDGKQPTGGVQGRGLLCTSPGIMQQLKLGGTIYGGWRSTEDSVIAFRLNEPIYISVGQRQGFFDLYGKFRGPELVMDGRNSWGERFQSGLRIEQASVTLDWGSYSDFKAVCDGMAR